MECYIDFKDWLNITKNNCYYCDKTPQDVGKIVHGLDRVDSKETYTMDNVVSCCYDCNVMKSDLNQNIFYQHINKIYNIWRLKHGKD